MFKPTVAIASLLTGTAAASAAGYVQTNGTAFTSRPDAAYWTPNPYARAYDPLRPTYVELEAPVETPSDEEPVFLLKGASKRSVLLALAPKRRAVRVLGPCSSWRDIGVKAVAGPAGPETRYVRNLCK